MGAYKYSAREQFLQEKIDHDAATVAKLINLPHHFSLGSMMNGSTTKVFASWERVMTRGPCKLMLKRLSLGQRHTSALRRNEGSCERRGHWCGRVLTRGGEQLPASLFCAVVVETTRLCARLSVGSSQTSVASTTG
jgi:hypothetical protein